MVIKNKCLKARGSCKAPPVERAVKRGMGFVVLKKAKKAWGPLRLSSFSLYSFTGCTEKAPPPPFDSPLNRRHVREQSAVRDTCTVVPAISTLQALPCKPTEHPQPAYCFSAFGRCISSLFTKVAVKHGYKRNDKET
jgi:hypothetical protein